MHSSSPFLIFVKKAATLRDQSALSSWLHGVAFRVARKARGQDYRRQFVEKRAAEQAIGAEPDPEEGELRSVLDEEIRRLPERYRLPLVLCHVEGLRHEEVAHRLGCPIGTVESRLSRARQRLRDRLTLRGLSPTASAMAAVLRPHSLSPVAPWLVDATWRRTVQVTAPRMLGKPAILSALSCVRQIPSLSASVHAGAAASIVAIVAGLAVMSFAVYRAQGEPPNRVAMADRSAPKANDPSDRLKNEIATAFKARPVEQPPPRDESSASNNQKPADPIPPARFPSATARPLEGITIDGRLDDWPRDLPRYAIRNQLVTHPSYDSTETLENRESSPYFMAGFNRKAGLLYLAVVVHDDDNVVHPSDTLGTDAVEIYVDGSLRDRQIPAPGGDWRETLDARTMPVLQYAGVPGNVSAYGDPWGANPSLVYARQRESRTKMKYVRSGDVDTYEWAVAVFDSFPKEPTELLPGKKLGLEIAVVDKDRKKPLSKSSRPSFRTWGAPPVEFKGINSGSLGELALEESPAP